MRAVDANVLVRLVTPDEARQVTAAASFVAAGAWVGNWFSPREFLHRFGRQTNQEVVVVELSGAEGAWFFRIKEYDE
jgi:hypothetical protein